MTNEIKRYRLPLNLQLFAEDPPADPPADPPQDPPKTFTQAELDAKIADRLARERKKYEGFDELKAERDRLKSEEDARKAATLTETERLQTEKAEALKKAEEADTAAQGKIDAANQRLIKAEFRAKARELGIRTDALDDAIKLADLSAVTVDDDGNAIGVEDVVKALVAGKPYLTEQTKTKPRQIGEGSNHDDKSTQKTAEQLLAEAAEKARKSGRIEDRAAYAALKAELSK